MANDVQRAMNILTSTISGGLIALSKGKKPEKKPETNESETGDVLSSLAYTTDLSADEAVQKAFDSANQAIEQKYKARERRRTRLSSISNVMKNEGGKE